MLGLFCSCSLTWDNELVLFQTSSICARSCATRAAVGPALWPQLSGADVAPRLRFAEISAAVFFLSPIFFFLFWRHWRFERFLLYFPGGPMWENPKRRWGFNKYEYSPPWAAILCLNPDFCLSRGARLHLREALQQEALLWPTQVWGALLCGECSLNLGQCFWLYALCSHTHIYIFFFSFPDWFWPQHFCLTRTN